MECLPIQVLLISIAYGWLTFIEPRELPLLNVLLDVDDALSGLVGLDFTLGVSECGQYVAIARISDFHKLGLPLQRSVLNLEMLNILLQVLHDHVGNAGLRIILLLVHQEADL